MLRNNEESFLNHLAQIIKFIKKPYLTNQQLSMVFQEANILYSSTSQEKKIKKLFLKKTIPTFDIFKLFTLDKLEIKHNKPYFFVKVSTISDHFHKESECFEWWKKFMAKKYGSQMRWFQVITQQLSCRRTKSYTFKERIKEILTGTPHEGCQVNICHYFPKNRKNEIQFSTFMSVLRLDRNKYLSNNQTQIQKRKSSKLSKRPLNSTLNLERRSKSVRQRSVRHENEDELKETMHIKTAVSFKKKPRNLIRIRGGDLSRLHTEVIKIQQF